MSHEEHKELQEAFLALNKKFDTLEAKLTPVIDTWNAANRLGKWASALLVFLSIMIGVALSLKELFKK